MVTVHSHFAGHLLVQLLCTLKGMSESEIGASAFRERCLALLDQVERTRTSFVITKRGRPVARLVPLDERSAVPSLLGSVRLVAEHDEDYFSSGEDWSADR